LIVGIEVECKLGLAVWPEHYDVGWFVPLLLPLHSHSSQS
jgi:hypothetical protein